MVDVLHQPEYQIAFNGYWNRIGHRSGHAEFEHQGMFMLIDLIELSNYPDQHPMIDALIDIEIRDHDQLVQRIDQYSPQILCINQIDTDNPLPKLIGNTSILIFDEDTFFENICRSLFHYCPRNIIGHNTAKLKTLTHRFMVTLNFEMLLRLAQRVDSLNFDISTDNYLEERFWAPQSTFLGQYFQEFAKKSTELKAVVINYFFYCCGGVELLNFLEHTEHRVARPFRSRSARRAISVMHAILLNKDLDEQQYSKVPLLLPTPLMVATILEPTAAAAQTIRKCLAMGYSPIMTDKIGNSAFTLALKYSRFGILTMLCEEWHDAQLFPSRGLDLPNTILNQALALEQVPHRAMQLIIRRSELHHYDETGILPIHVSVTKDPRYLAEILASGADPNATDKIHQNSALHFLIQNFDDESQTGDKTDLTENLIILCLCGANLTQKNREGQSPFELIFSWTDREKIQLILDIVADYLSFENVSFLLEKYQNFISLQNPFNLDDFSVVAIPLLNHHFTPLHFFPMCLLESLEQLHPLSFENHIKYIAGRISTHQPCTDAIALMLNNSVDEVVHLLKVAIQYRNATVVKFIIYHLNIDMLTRVLTEQTAQFLIFLAVMHSSNNTLVVLLKFLESQNLQTLRQHLTSITYHNRTLIRLAFELDSIECVSTLLLHTKYPQSLGPCSSPALGRKYLFHSDDKDIRLVMYILNLCNFDLSYLFEWAKQKASHQRLFLLASIYQDNEDMFSKALEHEFPIDVCQYFDSQDARRDKLDRLLTTLPPFIQRVLAGDLFDLDQYWMQQRQIFINSGHSQWVLETGCGSQSLLRGVANSVRQYGPLYQPEIPDELTSVSPLMRYYLQKASIDESFSPCDIPAEYCRLHPFLYTCLSQAPSQSVIFAGLCLSSSHSGKLCSPFQHLSALQCAIYMAMDTGSQIDHFNLEFILKERIDCRVDNITDETIRTYTQPSIRNRLFQYGVWTPNHEEREQLTTLHRAIIDKDMNVVRTIFEEIAQLQIQQQRDIVNSFGFGTTALMLAACTWDTGYQYLKHQPVIDQDITDEKGLTAKFYHCHHHWPQEQQRRAPMIQQTHRLIPF